MSTAAPPPPASQPPPLPEPASDPGGRAFQPATPASECKTAADLWSRALDATANSARTQSMLQAARPIRWEGQTLTVELAAPMRAVLEHRAEEIEKLLRGIAGRKVVLEVREPEASGDADRAEPPPDAATLAKQHPLVQQAMELFGGKVERAYYKQKP